MRSVTLVKSYLTDVYQSISIDKVQSIVAKNPEDCNTRNQSKHILNTKWVDGKNISSQLLFALAGEVSLGIVAYLANSVSLFFCSTEGVTFQH